MPTVTLTTDLPVSAEAACALARKPELFGYLLRPILRMRALRRPDHIAPGARMSARLWWFGAVPTWTHHLTLVRLGATEIYTNEHGGPIRTWNHRLTFVPTGDHSCRYTDEIELGDGWRGALAWPVVHVLFRHRHRRWRALTRILA